MELAHRAGVKGYLKENVWPPKQLHHHKVPPHSEWGPHGSYFLEFLTITSLNITCSCGWPGTECWLKSQGRILFPLSLLLLESVSDSVTIIITSLAPCVQLIAVATGQVKTAPTWLCDDHSVRGREDNSIAVWWLWIRTGSTDWGGTLESCS